MVPVAEVLVSVSRSTPVVRCGRSGGVDTVVTTCGHRYTGVRSVVLERKYYTSVCSPTSPQRVKRNLR